MTATGRGDMAQIHISIFSWIYDIYLNIYLKP